MKEDARVNVPPKVTAGEHTLVEDMPTAVEHTPVEDIPTKVPLGIYASNRVSTVSMNLSDHNVKLYNFNTREESQWVFFREIENIYLIFNKKFPVPTDPGGRIMLSRNDNNVVVEPMSNEYGASRQRWRIYKVGNNSVGEDIVQIENAEPTSLLLTVRGSITVDNTNIAVAQPGEGSGVVGRNQMFIIRKPII